MPRKPRMNTMANTGTVLLVEDNADDGDLTIRSFRKSGILNPVQIVRDGAEALDYLFCKGKFAERDPKDLPVVVLLDLKMPKVGGLEVLQRIRQTPETRLLPV